MESRRFSGNNHWYHETLATGRADTRPLMPEAATVVDPFLLGADDNAAAPLCLLLNQQQSPLLAAQNLYHQLFPVQVVTTRLHTLTLYDRLSSALTVAQVTGIQRLCNHYAARLNPLLGPDSSRESNQRLTQITEYARLMSSQPWSLNSAALQRLHDVGLTLPDIISFHQLIGFVGYQARVVAGLHALQGLPVRRLPGQTLIPDAPPAACHDDLNWQTWLNPPLPGYLSDKQRDVVTKCRAQDFPAEILGLLAQDETVLSEMSRLQQAIGFVDPLLHAVCARINGSGWHLQQYRDRARRDALLADPDRLVAGLFSESQLTIIQAASGLTRAPDRFSSSDMQPLLDTLPLVDIWQFIQQTALANWLSRLFQTLGTLSPE